jgi:hypothetical protein
VQNIAKQLVQVRRSHAASQPLCYRQNVTQLPSRCCRRYTICTRTASSIAI